MDENVCLKCGKEKTPARAGSITSYFFQHNFCRCEQKSAAIRSRAQPVSSGDSHICLNCGKSRPKSEHAGSFTNYLFKELRCQCKAPRFALAAKDLKRTAAAERTEQKRLLAKDPRSHQASNRPATKIGAGTIIGGTLKIESLIGEGGMGRVYLARHLALGREFALKILSPSLISEEHALRFQAEAKTLAALHHVNLVQVYDLGIHANSLFYYSMDYLPGRSLEDVLASEGPLSLEETLSVYTAVLDGLAYAHRNGVIHRDIKPANIFICHGEQSNSARVKILDFGIAKLINNSDKNSEKQQLTAVGEVFGSPYYMSPEQCAGDQVDARSDLYSIGCSIFESLTGFVPFEAATSLEIALMHEERDPPSLSQVAAREFPQSIEAVISKCLAKQPRERYQSAKELALDLERIKDGREVTASLTPSAVSRSKQRPPRERIGAIAIIATLTAVLLFCSLSIFAWKFCHAKKKITSKSGKMADLQTTEIKFSSPQIESALTPQIQYVDEYLETKTKYYSEIEQNKGKEEKREKIEKVFNFPRDFSIGIIEFEKAGQVTSKAAQGSFSIPPDVLVSYKPNRLLEEHLTLLKRFRSDDLDGFRMHSDKISAKIVVSYVRNFTSLKSLDLSGMYLDSHDIGELNRLYKLSKLNLFIGKNDAPALAKCSFLPRLTSLKVTNCRDLSALLQALLASKNLNELSITDSVLTRDDYRALSNLQNLKHLYLFKVSVKVSDLAQLTKLKQLHSLLIEKGTKLDRSCFFILKQFKNLKQLTMPPGILSSAQEQELHKELQQRK